MTYLFQNTLDLTEAENALTPEGAMLLLGFMLLFAFLFTNNSYTYNKKYEEIIMILNEIKDNNEQVAESHVLMTNAIHEMNESSAKLNDSTSKLNDYLKNIILSNTAVVEILIKHVQHIHPVQAQAQPQQQAHPQNTLKKVAMGTGLKPRERDGLTVRPPTPLYTTRHNAIDAARERHNIQLLTVSKQE